VHQAAHLASCAQRDFLQGRLLRPPGRGVVARQAQHVAVLLSGLTHDLEVDERMRSEARPAQARGPRTHDGNVDLQRAQLRVPRHGEAYVHAIHGGPSAADASALTFLARLCVRGTSAIG